MENLLKSIAGRNLSNGGRKEIAIRLASLILAEADKEQTLSEKRRYKELSRMMHDPVGKAFTMAMTDECFRSEDPKRVASQMLYLLEQFGIPKFLGVKKRLGLLLFRSIGDTFPGLLVPLAKRFLRKETSTVIIPGEKRALSRHIRNRRAEGVRLNINHLGEAILGEKEATRRLHIYLRDLDRKDIDYVSIKISTIFSQINLVAYDETVEAIAKRLRLLYRAAMPDKFVNLDMEEYRDLHLTKDVFMKVLSEPEFENYSAGIVLQAYLPDTYEILKELTEWAKKRPAPIKVRIVKGANMTMEQFEASLHTWPQAPYKTKVETDANYKRMLAYACRPENAAAVHIGVASHNIFDISYALVLRAENGVEREISFEMLEGMADHIRRVLQRLTGDMLLYCAVATKEDFQSAIAYLIRRLDENTGIQNFLAHSFGLKEGSKEWHEQVTIFEEACDLMETVSKEPRRFVTREHLPNDAPFENEPDTDFSLPENRKWVRDIIATWKEKEMPLPPKIENTLPILENAKGGVDPMLIHDVAKKLRDHRADLIGVMVLDGNKIVSEADVEVSEAIDFCEYYVRSYKKLIDHPDLSWKPKGTILITPPWNFPIAIPTGGIVAALVTGNAVLFKPAPESMLAGWVLTNLLWDAGIPKEALQFIHCDDDPIGTAFIKDPRVNAVVLTGATETARHFLKLRPGLDLSAETGGKNAMIITALADRDQAIKDLIRSAFGHNGQKCSAASLAVLEAEVYDDPHFLEQLKDAAESLRVGSQWELTSFITPLIREPGKELKRALLRVDPGEKWLLKPKKLSETLWSPGIKLGVKKGSFSHRTEFFGPVLSLMRADNIYDAIRIANGTPYGLTSGIHTLDQREQMIWEKSILAGNCYINRGITGAVVQRQPFGGCKNSVYGHGSKAGGPNYLAQFMHCEQVGVPKEKHAIGFWVNNLTRILEKIELSAEELGIWYASISSYAFWWDRFKKGSDKTRLVGQDNFLHYRSHKKTIFRIDSEDSPLDYLRVFAAALTCETPLHISWDTAASEFATHINWQAQFPIFTITYETEKEFIKRLSPEKIKRIRIIHKPSQELLEAAAQTACYINSAPILSNGRIELLNYLREIAVSTDYHRYGNLGMREHDLRKPIL